MRRILYAGQLTSCLDNYGGRIGNAIKRPFCRSRTLDRLASAGGKTHPATEIACRVIRRPVWNGDSGLLLVSESSPGLNELTHLFGNEVSSNHFTAWGDIPAKTR